MSENTSNPQYIRTTLYECDAFEVVACEWEKGAISPMHGHGDSSCSVLVQEGLFENTTAYEFKSEVQAIEKGQTFVTPLGAQHELRCVSPRGKTLHVYSPKIVKADSQVQFAPQSPDVLKKNLDLALTDEGSSYQQIFENLEAIEKSSITTDSPFFMNQLFSGVFSQTRWAENTLQKTRTTLATFEASPALSLIEQQVTDQLGALIGWKPELRAGITVPGGSAANFMSIHCARQKKFPDARREGLGNQKVKLYISHEAHYSFRKAVAVLGLGTDTLVSVDTDARGQMDVRHLKSLIERDLASGHTPLYIGATIGTTVFGAIDPLDELAAMARQYNMWLHADAAWGAPALFSEKLKPRLKGLDQCDSLTFDAHKFFGSSLTSSFFLIQHPQLLLEANDTKGGEYLFHESDTLDRGRLSWQCGRGGDVLSFWTLWKNLGTQGMTASIDNMLDLREECVRWIQDQPRLKLVHDPEFLNICVEILTPTGERDPLWSKHVREQLRLSNTAMVNYSTTKTNAHFLRLILVHPHIKLHHLKDLLTSALEVKV